MNTTNETANQPDRVAELTAEVERLRGLLSGLVYDIQGLMSESEGVAGLHSNGDVAPWSELESGGQFERLTHLPEAALAGSSPAPMTAAARDVLAERQRQIKIGYSDIDDQQINDELAAMACFYAMPPGARDWPAEETGYGATFGVAIVPDGWFPETGDRRRELVKAGAMVLAEIERLDRAAGKEAQS